MQSLVKRRHKRFFISQEKYVFRTKNAIILPFDVTSHFVESNLNYDGDKKTKLHKVVVEEDTCDPIDIMNELLDKEGSLRHGDQLPKHVETHATLPPTVVVLGERDHGKTSLVNALTGRRVREKGGITQRIGAARYYFNYFDEIDDSFNADEDNRSELFSREASVTLLDTPGHQHFVDMQRESAFNADLALVVIACDEGITSGTASVMQHAFDANIPLSFALTKSDLLGDADRWKERHIKEYIQTKFPDSLTVSLDNLNDTENRNRALKCGKMLSDWARQNEVYVRSAGYASCFILDTFSDRSRGMLLRVLVLEGKLKIDDSFVAGAMHGVVRNLYCVFNRTNPIVGSGVNFGNSKKSGNGRGVTYEVTEALPGDVVDIMLRGRQGKMRKASLPRMGEGMFCLPEEQSKNIVDYRIMESTLGMHLNHELVGSEVDELGVDSFGVADSDLAPEKMFPLVVKANTSGGLMSIQNILDMTSLDMVVSGIGRVTKHDVDVASMYDTIVVAYDSPVSREMENYANSKGVHIEHGDVLPTLLEALFERFEITISPNTMEGIGGANEIPH